MSFCKCLVPDIHGTSCTWLCSHGLHIAQLPSCAPKWTFFEGYVNTHADNCRQLHILATSAWHALLVHDSKPVGTSTHTHKTHGTLIASSQLGLKRKLPVCKCKQQHTATETRPQHGRKDAAATSSSG
jgi:hypothetical protein